jgi:hypothetical protein
MMETAEVKCLTLKMEAARVEVLHPEGEGSKVLRNVCFPGTSLHGITTHKTVA